MNSILATIQGKFELDSGHNVNIPVYPINTPSPHFESEHIYNITDSDEVFDALLDLYNDNNVIFNLINRDKLSQKIFMYSDQFAAFITPNGANVMEISIGTGTDSDGKTYYFINLEPTGSNS